MPKPYFSENKYSRWINVLSLAGVAVAVYLVVNEFIAPGYCPKYPVIGVPACYFVSSFFIIVFLVRYVKRKRLALILFYFANIAGAVTAVWFSSNHLLGNLQCPVLLKTPLCYAALLTFITLIVLGSTGFNRSSK